MVRASEDASTLYPFQAFPDSVIDASQHQQCSNERCRSERLSCQVVPSQNVAILRNPDATANGTLLKTSFSSVHYTNTSSLVPNCLGMTVDHLLYLRPNPKKKKKTRDRQSCIVLLIYLSEGATVDSASTLQSHLLLLTASTTIVTCFVATMVNTGKPSRGCYMCRARRIKVLTSHSQPQPRHIK
jgi:hypothetical protein